MSDVPLKQKSLDIILNGEFPKNHLWYVKKQAMLTNQIIYTLAIKHSVILEMAKRHPSNDCIYMLNDIIPDGAIRIKQTSERIKAKMMTLFWKTKQSMKKLNRGSSKNKRTAFLEAYTNVSVLVSDSMTAAEFEENIQQLEKKAKELQEKLDNLNIVVEEWKQSYQNLEREKQLLYEELQLHSLNENKILEEKIGLLETEKENMRSHIHQLERGSTKDLPSNLKDMTDLSKRQQNRRVQALGTRAQKALWFIKRFGLEFEGPKLSDQQGHSYPIHFPTNPTPQTTPQTPSAKHQTPPTTHQIPPTTPQTPLPEPQTLSTTPHTPSATPLLPSTTPQIPPTAPQTPPITPQTPPTTPQTSLSTSKEPLSILQTPLSTPRAPSMSQTPPCTT